MTNCILCSKKPFGSMKLSDGSLVCTSCFGKIHKINPNFALKLKNHTINDVKELLQEKTEKEEQQKARLNEIKKQIQELKLNDASNYLGRREINELPTILAPNEFIDNLAQGTYNNGQGILVSTNRRLLFVDKGMFYGLKVEDFPLDKITSIQYETGLLLGSIKIHSSGNIAKIDHVEKTTARSFAEFVRDKLSQPKETVVTTTAVSVPNVLDQLEKLAKLKENGILSEEEFNEQKKKLLEKL